MRPDIDAEHEKFNDAVTAFFVPMQTTRDINLPAFEQMHASAIRLARLLQHDKLVPKKVLEDASAPAMILRTEALHAGERRAMLEALADRMDYCFGLLLTGGVPEDRTGGVPRII